MLLIGESLNVISKKIGKAFKERDPKPIQEEAQFQKEKGMDFIDINLGPAKKDGPELMPWVVQTVQEVVDDILAFVHLGVCVGVYQERELEFATQLLSLGPEARSLHWAGIDNHVQVQLGNHLPYDATKRAPFNVVQFQHFLRRFWVFGCHDSPALGQQGTHERGR